MKKILFLLLLLPLQFLFAQKLVDQKNTKTSLSPLTVKKIMRDPKWIGTQPSNPFWSPNGEKLYFNWNPEKAVSDSLYFITLKNHKPQKASSEVHKTVRAQRRGSYNSEKSKLVYTKDQAIYS